MHTLVRDFCFFDGRAIRFFFFFFFWKQSYVWEHSKTWIKNRERGSIFNDDKSALHSLWDQHDINNQHCLHVTTSKALVYEQEQANRASFDKKTVFNCLISTKREREREEMRCICNNGSTGSQSSTRQHLNDDKEGQTSISISLAPFLMDLLCQKVDASSPFLLNT